LIIGHNYGSGSIYWSGACESQPERLAYTALQHEADTCLQQCNSNLTTTVHDSNSNDDGPDCETIDIARERIRVDRFAVSDTYVLSASGKEGDRSPRS